MILEYCTKFPDTCSGQKIKIPENTSPIYIFGKLILKFETHKIGSDKALSTKNLVKQKITYT